MSSEREKSFKNNNNIRKVEERAKCFLGTRLEKSFDFVLSFSSTFLATCRMTTLLSHSKILNFHTECIHSLEKDRKECEKWWKMKIVLADPTPRPHIKHPSEPITSHLNQLTRYEMTHDTRTTHHVFSSFFGFAIMHNVKGDVVTSCGKKSNKII